jgi:hypothetical protein
MLRCGINVITLRSPRTQMARPRLPDSTRHTVALKVSDADLLRIKFAAALSGKPMGAVLRKACQDYLDSAGIPSVLATTAPQEPQNA